MKRKASGVTKNPRPKKRASYTKASKQTIIYGRRGADAEKKVADVGPGQFSANTTGQFSLLAAPVPGNDFTNRIGRKVLLKSLYIRGIVTCELADQDGPTVGASPAQLARMIIFEDKQPNGAAPAVLDLLTSATSQAQLNLNNRDRFKIIRDEQFALEAYAYSTTATQAVASLSNAFDIKMYIKLNIEMIFNAGTAGTIADITSGALYMFWIGNRVAGTDDATAALSCRTRFIDM